MTEADMWTSITTVLIQSVFL